MVEDLNTDRFPQRKIWVVRHGMRIDFVDENWAKLANNPYDPPLHADGKTQAEETGCRLAEESIAHIFTSPFLRTIQTAQIIASRLDLRFFVENGFAEWLNAGDFKYQPSVREPGEIEKEFSQFDRNHRSRGRMVFPEDSDTLDRRIAVSVERILRNFAGNILIISHASPIDSLFRYFLNENPIEFQPMCAVSRFDQMSKRWILGIDRDSSHLSIKDDRNKVFYRSMGLTE